MIREVYYLIVMIFTTLLSSWYWYSEGVADQKEVPKEKVELLKIIRRHEIESSLIIGKMLDVCPNSKAAIESFTYKEAEEEVSNDTIFQKIYYSNDK